MIQPRRAVHAASLAISAVVGGAVASLLASRLGAGAATIGSIWTVTGIATLFGAWPVLVGGPMPASRYGALVMAGSGVRLLATLAVGLALDLGAAEGAGGGHLAFWMGVLVAAAAVIIGDSAVAVTTLGGAGRGAGQGVGGGAVDFSRASEPSVERA